MLRCSTLETEENKTKYSRTNWTHFFLLEKDVFHFADNMRSGQSPAIMPLWLRAPSNRFHVTEQIEAKAEKFGSPIGLLRNGLKQENGIWFILLCL